ncbi:retrovirus-related pol polyprotein from transposon TNT 1-94 [Tanacetum coccineum]
MPLEQFSVNTVLKNTLPGVNGEQNLLLTVKLGKGLAPLPMLINSAHLQQPERQAMKGRQTTYAAGTTRKYTPGASGSNTGKQRTVISKIALMANLSRNGSDALTEVHNPDNLNYDLFNQSEQIMTSSEQSNDVSQTETDITSDSNIIPYSQYLSETQQETVQNSNSSAQQDVLILSMFEQLSTQVTHCTTVNKALTTELDRYKEEVKDLKEMQNVENSFSGSNEQFAEILFGPSFRPFASSTYRLSEVPKRTSTVVWGILAEELKTLFTGFDQVVKERTTALQLSLEGTWGDNVDPSVDPKVSLSDDPAVSKIDMEPITPKLLNKRTAHSAYIKHTQEEAFVLRDIVEYEQGQKGVRLSSSASGSQPLGNTRKDKIQRPPSSNLKNKVEAHPRNVKSSLNKQNEIVKCNGSAFVQHFKKNGNSDSVCDNCMSSDNLCDVKSHVKSKPRPTSQTFTLVGNACPLTRITTTTEVPSRKPIVLETETSKPKITLTYSWKPRKNKNIDSISKPKVVQIVLWYLDSGCSKHMTGDRSQLTNFVSKFLGTVKFGNDHVAKIMGYGDYQIGNVTISRVYFVEGLGHNLFSVGQFCDSNLEVAFHQHTCYIQNLEGVDLLTGSRGDNLYTLSLGDMMASPPICLLSKASKTKSWLWHRRLSHLNFGSINHLARHGLVRGLPKLKFEKDHLCSACALGKSSKKPHKPKSEDTNQEKLYLLHMDLCGPMRVASVNGKKYILVIVDDYSRFTWVKCLRSKDEAPAFIINFLKMIQVRLKETVRRIRTDNGTEFVNQTLREYYEKVGISHETSVARSP